MDRFQNHNGKLPPGILLDDGVTAVKLSHQVPEGRPFLARSDTGLRMKFPLLDLDLHLWIGNEVAGKHDFVDVHILVWFSQFQMRNACGVKDLRN